MLTAAIEKKDAEQAPAEEPETGAGEDTEKEPERPQNDP